VQEWESAVHAVPYGRFDHPQGFTGDWQPWHSLLGFRVPFV
jgi:hypothetical protein